MLLTSTLTCPKCGHEWSADAGEGGDPAGDEVVTKDAEQVLARSARRRP